MAAKRPARNPIRVFLKNNCQLSRTLLEVGRLSLDSLAVVGFAAFARQHSVRKKTKSSKVIEAAQYAVEDMEDAAPQMTSFERSQKRVCLCHDAWLYVLYVLENGGFLAAQSHFVRSTGSPQLSQIPVFWGLRVNSDVPPELSEILLLSAFEYCVETCI